MTSDESIGVEAVLDLAGVDRAAKAYAFLYAAFKRTEVSKNPVRDAIDCLVPFAAPYINSIAGRQVTVEPLRDYLEKTYGFAFPLYAVELLINDLQRHGLAQYNVTTKIFVAKEASSDQFAVSKAEIETRFDLIADRLEGYAKALGYPEDPKSGNWSQALINFLKGVSSPGKVGVTVRGAIVDAQKTENVIIGAFIKKIHATDTETFEALLDIFMGILIEDFISSISELKLDNGGLPITVFYDTAVLLRLLGTSGRMHKIAAEELTRYLQDLGCNVYYFAGNESEVANIFGAIVHAKDSGKELEGETAEAISAGEVSISDIRLLQNTFPERLAAKNVFSAENIEENAQDNAKYQIDEKGFSAFLLSQANVSGRAYGVQNREHDAMYLGAVMRLRRGNRTRDFGACRYIFVTSNRFLAQTSRRYLIKEKFIQPQHCPPMLSVGQVATIAWLMKDQKLVPEKAGRELLANCFAAVRPDAEWFKHFREGMEKVTGSIEEYGQNASNALTLQAARRIAQEESFGSAALVRDLNMAEVLHRAEQERERQLAERAAELETIKLAAAEEKRFIEEAAAEERRRLAEDADQRSRDQTLQEDIRRADAVRTVRQEVEEEARQMVENERNRIAAKNARTVILAMKIMSSALFAIVLAYSAYATIAGKNSVLLWSAVVIIGVVTLFSFLDLVRIPLVERFFGRFEQSIIQMQLGEENVDGRH